MPIYLKLIDSLIYKVNYFFQVDEKGLKYRSYSVHINGILHCQLRYRQFHNLHLQLRREFGPTIPQFPPKKLFTLNEAEIEERRLNLEKYLQLISQECCSIKIDFFPQT